jgi:hypothetical protein
MAENPFDLTVAPVTEPVSLIAGSWVGWRRELDYDDATFRLEYRFGTTDHDHIVVGEQVGTEWHFEIASADSTGFTAGDYRWDLYIVRLSDDEEYALSTGMMKVFGSTTDRRTHAEIMVAKIESILAGRADSDVMNYSIKNRSITKMSPKELVEWRDYYLVEIGRTGGSVTSGKVVKQNTVRARFI